MKVVKNAYVNKQGAYYESGGIIEGTQRIPTNHIMSYWQQANIENRMACEKESFNSDKIIERAIYVGRIPTHLGHFIMEGLPRLCDSYMMNIPAVGYIADGFLPEGIEATPREQIEWVVKASISHMFYEIDEGYFVNTLYVPELPIVLSQSCSEPWRMSDMIEKIVDKSRGENEDIEEIDELYLKRFNEEVKGLTSNPREHISKQIAQISYAKKLFGKSGSNTHMSIFAKNDCRTEWVQRGDFLQTDRNQLICDLVKTYNKFD